jgi:chromosome segregation ATPase
MHRLEAALESAGPGREASWQDEVMGGLSVLDEAITEESENASRADSLLSDIARTQPRLRNRVRGARMQYQQLRDRVTALRRELEEADPTLDVADLRERLASVLHGLRHQRARESDLIYEAYYEAFRAELDQ